MKLPFLNRVEELARLKKAFSSRTSSLVCLYGRRRCGKSRLLLEALKGHPHVYYVGDNTEGVLQIKALSDEIGRLIQDFDRAAYSGWEQLLLRWWKDAQSGAVLALDEFPFMVQACPELPSLLQKMVDKETNKTRHIVLCGSSQRMMHGIVLNGSAPLYGRAKEIIKLKPLSAYYALAAGLADTPQKAIEVHALWGGVPRYWELASEHSTLAKAVSALVLSPLGVLHSEPERLIADEMHQTRIAFSILTLIGQGCERTSEIASRLNMQATSLMRPLSLLVDLGFVQRDIPFGRSMHDTKRTLYKIADPFLRYWFRFVEPNRSLLEAGKIKTVIKIIQKQWNPYMGVIWEECARASVARMSLFKQEWLPASRWWGSGSDRSQIELDIVAQSVKEKNTLLFGEAKLTASSGEGKALLEGLKRKVERVPEFKAINKIYALWIMNAEKGNNQIIGAADVVQALR